MSTWKFQRDLPVSKLKPIFGMVRISASPALCKMVVFPAQSKPSIKTFISLVPVSCAQVLAICAPIALALMTLAEQLAKWLEYNSYTAWTVQTSSSTHVLQCSTVLHASCKCKVKHLEWISQWNANEKAKASGCSATGSVRVTAEWDRRWQEKISTVMWTVSDPKETDYRIVIAISQNIITARLPAPRYSDLAWPGTEPVPENGGGGTDWCEVKGCTLMPVKRHQHHLLSHISHVQSTCAYSPHKPFNYQLQSTLEICSYTHITAFGCWGNIYYIININ